MSKSNGKAPAREPAAPDPAAPAVEVVPLESLVQDPANVRRRDERAKDTLRASLTRFGPARSAVIDGKGVIRAGNGTVEAAHNAGITQAVVIDAAPDQLVVVRRKDWTPSEAAAYSIADNRTTDLSEFDPVALATAGRALQSEDFDLDAIGFTPAEIDEMCAGLGDAVLDGSDALDDAAPPEDFAEHDEGIETEYTCPRCSYSWSGKPK